MADRSSRALNLKNLFGAEISQSQIPSEPVVFTQEMKPVEVGLPAQSQAATQINPYNIELESNVASNHRVSHSSFVRHTEFPQDSLVQGNTNSSNLSSSVSSNESNLFQAMTRPLLVDSEPVMDLLPIGNANVALELFDIGRAEPHFTTLPGRDEGNLIQALSPSLGYGSLEDIERAIGELEGVVQEARLIHFEGEDGSSWDIPAVEDGMAAIQIVHNYELGEGVTEPGDVMVEPGLSDIDLPAEQIGFAMDPSLAMGPVMMDDFVPVKSPGTGVTPQLDFMPLINVFPVSFGPTVETSPSSEPFDLPAMPIKGDMFYDIGRTRMATLEDLLALEAPDYSNFEDGGFVGPYEVEAGPSTDFNPTQIAGLASGVVGQFFDASEVPAPLAINESSDWMLDYGMDALAEVMGSFDPDSSDPNNIG